MGDPRFKHSEEALAPAPPKVEHGDGLFDMKTIIPAVKKTVKMNEAGILDEITLWRAAQAAIYFIIGRAVWRRIKKAREGRAYLDPAEKIRIPELDKTVERAIKRATFENRAMGEELGAAIVRKAAERGVKPQTLREELIGRVQQRLVFDEMEIVQLEMAAAGGASEEKVNEIIFNAIQRRMKEHPDAAWRAAKTLPMAEALPEAVKQAIAGMGLADAAGNPMTVAERANAEIGVTGKEFQKFMHPGFLAKRGAGLGKKWKAVKGVPDWFVKEWDAMMAWLKGAGRRTERAANAEGLVARRMLENANFLETLKGKRLLTTDEYHQLSVEGRSLTEVVQDEKRLAKIAKEAETILERAGRGLRAAKEAPKLLRTGAGIAVGLGVLLITNWICSPEPTEFKSGPSSIGGAEKARGDPHPNYRWDIAHSALNNSEIEPGWYRKRCTEAGPLNHGMHVSVTRRTSTPQAGNNYYLTVLDTRGPKLGVSVAAMGRGEFPGMGILNGQIVYGFNPRENRNFVANAQEGHTYEFTLTLDLEVRPGHLQHTYSIKVEDVTDPNRRAVVGLPAEKPMPAYWNNYVGATGLENLKQFGVFEVKEVPNQHEKK